MIINFFLRYQSRFGQEPVLHFDEGQASPHILSLQYLNEEYWFVKFDNAALINGDELNYRYFIREEGQADRTDFSIERRLRLKKLKEKEINVYDEWQDNDVLRQVFQTKSFAVVFNQKKFKVKNCDSKKPSHIFRVATSFLPQGKFLCITGEAKRLNRWDRQHPLILKKRGQGWSIKLDLRKEKFPFEYKFAVYDAALKEVTQFEDGGNRVLHKDDKGKTSLNILHQFVDFPREKWRGAGLNVQLSSLKSKNSWGIGDFTDLYLLVDWAQKCGLKMIQLLPVNDTTATNTQKDSYPYAAISAFALHPIFLNVQKLATALALEFPDKMLATIGELNNKPFLDYEQVWRLKRSAILELFEKDRLSFKDDFAFFDFFDLHRAWLTPYAVFCTLRDKHGTADFTRWPELSVYDEDAVQAFASPGQPHYDQIALHYFTQFHLHLQLLDVVQHAHSCGIILKGDLPIGVGRFSADTWMHPELFHMEMQAGAPPDAFALSGQNWGFPTYNWEAMRHNGYAWWRQRMEYMSHYFDAVRLDHVLGFFRIWSIPLPAVNSVNGHFDPAHSLSADDFCNAGVAFSEERFCGLHDEEIILLRDESKKGHYHFRIGMQMTAAFGRFSSHEQQVLNEMYRKYFFETQNDLWFQAAQSRLDAIQKNSDMLICAEDLGMVPDMVDGVLKSREILSLQVQRMPKISTETFASPGGASYLTVVTPSTHDMGTLREWWEDDRTVIQRFYNQVLGHTGLAPFYCEPWIATEIVMQHLASPAMWCVFLMQDVLSISPELRRENPKDERINFPADPGHFWNYRLHLTLEELRGNENFAQKIKALIQAARR